MDESLRTVLSQVEQPIKSLTWPKLPPVVRPTEPSAEPSSYQEWVTNLLVWMHKHWSYDVLHIISLTGTLEPTLEQFAMMTSIRSTSKPQVCLRGVMQKHSS